jgi:hypothetical protein
VTVKIARSVNREEGALLLELMMALSLLLVGLLALMGTFAINFKATRDVVERDEARVALENLTETLRNHSFQDIYNDYNGSAIGVPALKGAGGGNAAITVTCHVNELSIPAEFGPVLDIDDSGALDNTDCSADYTLLPVQLTLSYLTDHGTETSRVFLVLRG